MNIHEAIRRIQIDIKRLEERCKTNPCTNNKIMLKNRRRHLSWLQNTL